MKYPGFMIKKCELIFGILLIILLSATGGYFYGTRKYSTFLDSVHLVRANDSSYFFVHPILGFESPNALTINQFSPLVSKVKDIFNSNKGVVNRYSVYFRDLNKGFWIGINENDTYDPASMLKVALAVTVYKQAETDPSFLQSSALYTPALTKIIEEVPYSSPSQLKLGQSYVIEDLISRMIVDSDNGAKDILANNVNQNILQEVYTDLGIVPPGDTENYKISAKKYIVFFRTLYGGAYLNKEYSNDLLKLLSQTTFNNGLVGGVASSTIVSHKYGEHINSADNTITSTELHDCGIVYQAGNPYLLCIMTEGKDESDLASVIAGVSRVVNDEVVSGYK